MPLMEPMVAIAIFELYHLPPEVVLVNVVVRPTHKLDAPLFVLTEFTDKVFMAIQPDIL